MATAIRDTATLWRLRALSTSRAAISPPRKSVPFRSSSDFAHSTSDSVRFTSASRETRPSLARRSAASLAPTVARPRASDCWEERRSASACFTASSNSRASYSASTWPRVTASPRSTSRRAMVPGCSVRTCASSQARRLPTVSTERWTSRASAFATVIGSGLMAPGAAFAASFGGEEDCASDWLHPVAAIRSSTSAMGPRAEMRMRSPSLPEGIGAKRVLDPCRGPVVEWAPWPSRAHR